MELNNITNTGTWGQQVTRLNDNFNKVALGIDTLQEMYKSLSQGAIEVVDTLPQTGKANKIYRLVGTTSYSDYMYNADDLNTPILMATYNNAIDNTPTANSANLVTSGGVAEEFALGAVYDVSAKNPTAGSNNDGKWESLSALLSDANLNTLIPTAVRKGGMSIKFVQSSDNKYVQFRLMANEWSTTVSDWQGVDDVPTAGSDNLVKSGGVEKNLIQIIEFVGGTSDKADFTAINSGYWGKGVKVEDCQLGHTFDESNDITDNVLAQALAKVNVSNRNYLIVEGIRNPNNSYCSWFVLNSSNNVIGINNTIISAPSRTVIDLTAYSGATLVYVSYQYNQSINIYYSEKEPAAELIDKIPTLMTDVSELKEDISEIQKELNSDEEIINLRNVDVGINISSASSFPITRNMWSSWDDKNVVGDTKYSISTLVTINNKDKITVSSLKYKIRQFDVNGNTISPDAEYTTSFDQNSDIEFVTDANAKKIRMWSAMVVSACSSSEEILFKMDLQARIVHKLTIGLVDKVDSNTQDIAELEHDLNELVSSNDSYTLIGHLTETDKSGTRLEFPIIPNKEYILHMPSESWDITGYTTSYIFMLGYVDDNGVSHDWRGFTNFSQLPSFEGLKFSFNASKAFLFCRAANGVEVTFGIEYEIDNEYLKGITKNSQDIDSMQEDISQNTQDISEIQEELIAFNGKAFYSGEKISINQLYYKIYGGLKLTKSYAQGLDVYKDYLVYVENGGYIHIFNAKTLAQITEYQLATDSHCADICFGTEKYDANDTFPLMYAAKGNAMVELLRISLDGTSSIIQTITLTKPSGVGYVEGAVCIDYDRNKMYALGTTLSNIQTIPNNEYVIIEYDIPNISQSIVTLQPNRILAQWSYPQYTPSGNNDYPNPQGICYNSGKVFLSVGRNTIESNRMYVIDVESGTVVNDIRIGRDVYIVEPEGCTIYNGMYYCIAVNNVLYSVRF